MKDKQESRLDLPRAEAALARRDLVTAAQLAQRMVGSLSAPPALRSAAYRLLSLTAVEMELPEAALRYAVASTLMAHRSGDAECQRTAEAVLELVSTQYPGLSAASHRHQ